MRWVRAVQRERAARTRGLGLRVATTTNSLSCPAQAGHPVLTKVRAKLRAPAITGSSAYADDDKCKKGRSEMKLRRTTRRSFPGRYTLEEWLDLPAIGRRDMVRRTACALLNYAQRCANTECRRHRSCCGDDPAACQEWLWKGSQSRPRARSRSPSMALRRELIRLDGLARLSAPNAATPEPATLRAFWTERLYEPWNAPRDFPWESPGYGNHQPRYRGAG